VPADPILADEDVELHAPEIPDYLAQELDTSENGGALSKPFRTFVFTTPILAQKLFLRLSICFGILICREKRQKMHFGFCEAARRVSTGLEAVEAERYRAHRGAAGECTMRFLDQATGLDRVLFLS
jgi:hypothetical protein